MNQFSYLFDLTFIFIVLNILTWFLLVLVRYFIFFTYIFQLFTFPAWITNSALNTNAFLISTGYNTSTPREVGEKRPPRPPLLTPLRKYFHDYWGICGKRSLYIYEGSVVSLVFLLHNKGNNKITELRAILQRESQNS